MAWTFIAVGAIGILTGHLFNAGALIVLSAALFALSLATNFISGTDFFRSIFICFALICALQFCYFLGAGLALLQSKRKTILNRLLSIAAGSRKSDWRL